jgi:adenylate cyclase
MGREIERKFLVRSDAWRREASEGVCYRQGYLSTASSASARLRVAGDKAFLTIKGKPQGAARDEFEYQIPVADAEQMLDFLCAGPPIEKIRHDVEVGGVKWVVDEFAGQNCGLVLAEVELEDERQEIAIPDWAGKEVTEDERYSNRRLAEHPYREWGSDGL